MIKTILFLFIPMQVISQGQITETPIEEKSLASIHLEGFPDFLTSDTDGVWVTNTDSVEKLIFNQSRPVKTVSIPEPCGVMGAGFGSLWVVSCKEKSLYRINLQSGEITAIIQTGISDPWGELSVAIGAGSVWLVTDAKGELSRIDPTTNKITNRIMVQPNSHVVEFGFNSIWITNTEHSTVQRIDPTTNQVIATIPVGPTPRFLTTGAGAVWTLNQGDGTVSKIDPVSNQVVHTILVGVKETGGDITSSEHHVYVRGKKYLLTIIDANLNDLVSRFGPAAGSGAVRVENGRVWVTAHDINRIWILKE